MGQTANYQIPYPELTDPPDGPAQMKALADRIDTLLKSGVPMIQTGTITGGPNNTAGYSTTITFPRAFVGTPAVATNINSGGGTTFTSTSRAFGVSATGFTFNTNAPANVTFSVPLQWLASLTPTSPLAASRAEDGWHTVTATCHNSSCPKNDIPITDIMVPDDPAAFGWTGIICGACGQPITDIVPT